MVTLDNAYLCTKFDNSSLAIPEIIGVEWGPKNLKWDTDMTMPL